MRIFFLKARAKPEPSKHALPNGSGVVPKWEKVLVEGGLIR